MKKFLLIVLVAAVAALAISYSLRKSWRSSGATVGTFLPNDTLVLAQFADFNRALADWHRSDLYQIWSEPDVQKFLRKPRARFAATADTHQAFAQMEQLEMRNIFVAITSAESNAIGVVGGFQFSGKADDAERIVKDRRDQWLGEMAKAKRETVDYETHKIDVVSQGLFTIAMTFDRDWFFAANNLDLLKATLDRADGRVKEKQSLLAADETFASAMQKMPRTSAATVFVRADKALEKLAPALLTGTSFSTDALAPLRSIHAFCAATGFDDGKIRDTVFVAMPKTDQPELSRATLALGTADTFFYAATRVNFANATPTTPGIFPITSLSRLQNIAGTLAANGIVLDEWNAAFDGEFSIVGDWAAERRWPAVVATLPIKDEAKARNLIARMTIEKTDAHDWSRQEKNGVAYFTMESSGGLFSLSPTIAVAPKLLIVGGDPTTVANAVQRNESASAGLKSIAKFSAAEREVGPAQEAFAYFDSALFYTRLDAALRPMLIMGAAFLPTINDTIDLGDLPAPEVVAKHLRPTVFSKRMIDDGYMLESTGSITANQALLGLGGLGAMAGSFYEHQMRGGAGILGNLLPPLSMPAPQITPTPTPAATP